ncbi:MAG: late competence development ComFB family protein [Candidatus Omnitrophica bacterium]|nr:late competence development ComFB family protein [Candidatus Omnitrophota bacterium]
MEFHNYMEDIVLSILDSVLLDIGGVCDCERCKLDITALALNNLLPKYVVSHKGRVYTKLAELEFQFKADVVKEITKAVEVVKKNPQH